MFIEDRKIGAHGPRGPWALLIAVGLSTGCAALHSVQLGEIDSQTVMQGEKFVINLTEIGLDTDDAVGLVAAVTGESKHGQLHQNEKVESVGEIIKLFQIGPRTGYPVFRAGYSDGLMAKIKAKCPSGRVSGLISVRESADYGIVSGEIVKLIGYCAKGGTAP